MPTNFYMYFIVALIPLAVGFFYYNERVVGKIWMKVNGFTQESLQKGNMALIFLVSYIFSLLIAYTLTSLVIHQAGIFSTLAPEVMESGSEAQLAFNSFMENYGEKYRSFGHGAIHGLVASIFLILPILGTVALFERRGWKYILIHFIYWAICLTLMGGVLCQTLVFPELS